MSDHGIILCGVWGVTAICWGSPRVSGGVALVMTVVALFVSFY